MDITSPPRLVKNIIEQEGKDADSVSSWISSTQSPSHHRRPVLKESSSRLHHRLLRDSSFLIILLTISCCISLTSASHLYIDEQMIEGFEEDNVSEDIGSALARLARSGTILVDQGPPPNPKAWTLATEHDDLQRRGLDSSSSTEATSIASSPTSMITKISTSPSETTASSTSSSNAAAATDPAGPLPSPFDQGFNGNITSSCQSFMSGMLTNATFTACLPFSLLLQVLPLATTLFNYF